MSIRTLYFVFLLVAIPAALLAQTPSQTIRGTITDGVSHKPLADAMVVIVNSNPFMGVYSNEAGEFKFTDVAVGNCMLKISLLGYKDFVMPNVVVNSGKEVVLEIGMEEEIVMMDAVEISAKDEKGEPLNEMNAVSTRSFSVEETQKFAAAFNDPGRTASAFAGVMSTDDGSNAISIRGNSSYGLQWRMEGLVIPNPNHYASTASSGGGISILSAQLLSNSEFITGAFSAEYGNALAGVFDLRLRKGNNQKREYTIQAGFLGIDAAVEGPFSHSYNGSYLVNYRFSTLTLLTKMGLDLGDASTNFQDLSYHFYLPAGKLGSFSLYGFGGLSDQTYKAQRDSSEWEESWNRNDEKFHSNTAAAGMRHNVVLGTKSYLQSGVMLSRVDRGYRVNELDDLYVPVFRYDERHVNDVLTVSTVFNHKLNSRHSLRTGAYFNTYRFELFKKYLDEQTNDLVKELDSEGNAKTLQAFAQWKFRLSEPLTLQAGVHALRLLENASTSVEPRATLSYALSPSKMLSIGYGLHSQMQPVGTYESMVEQADGSYTKPNSELDFNKAHHVVMSYRHSFNNYFYVKSEIYYQHLFNIAVAKDINDPTSTLNMDGDHVLEPLVNSGYGRNYGLELTVEHFLHNRFYFLLTGSLFDAKYKALDGKWRNTRFNSNYAFNFTSGKEMSVGKKEKNKTFGVNIRTTYTGGLRDTPVDVAASMDAGYTEYVLEDVYTIKLKDYLRADVRFSMKRNRAKSTSTLSLDIQNVTNRKNVYGSYFDVDSGNVKEYYGLSLLPILSYKVEF